MDEESDVTLWDQLTAASYTSDAAEEKLLGPPCPLAAEHLWPIFLELHSARSSNGFGLNPLSFVELDAYQRVTGIELLPEEVSLLRLADEVSRQVLQVEDPPS